MQVKIHWQYPKSNKRNWGAL